ncbi:MAG: EAL domain-containing protein [Hyphomonadaceae bacterium]|nr:EAL domain-containing protein [Hyphomonadaceae bacterium]
MFFGTLSIVRTKPLQGGDLFRDAADFFTANPNIKIRAVVDKERRPVGAVSRTHLLAKASGKFGRALFDNRDIHGFLEDKTYVVTADQRLTDVFADVSAKDVTSAPEGYILVGPDGRYEGVIDGLVVLRALLSQNATLIGDLNREVVDRRSAEEDARRLADTDILTGLINRRVFIEALDHCIQANDPAVLVFVDLDRFKYLNDKYGHAVGDDVLCKTAERLADWSADALPARLGGDEFAVLIRHAERNQDLLNELEQLHTLLCEPTVSKPGVVNVGASLGIAFYPHDATSRGDWLHAADKAMARAKSNNGGIKCFDAAQDLAHDKQSQLSDALRTAISNNLLQPAFQPIVDIATGEISGYEVLARWNGPELDFVPTPSEFIPLAEREGLIEEVFWCVTRKAFKAYTDYGLDLKLALNVSPIQCRNRQFVSRLEELARRSGIALKNIEVEITETTMFRDMTDTVAVLQELHELGVSLALDDFGTGYSSLSLVKDLPLSKLKIDKSFVQSAATSRNARKIVSAAVGLSKALNMKCCAEGVEQNSQLAYLRKLGCEYGQGFLFGRPDLDLSRASLPRLKAAG